MDINEKQVVRLWQDVIRRQGVVSEEGELVTVVYPGRVNDSRGADFRDAVILRGGVRIRGDIEVHVRSSHWWEHKHHLDQAYNRVILHVVLWRDEKITQSHLPSGEYVPLVVLEKYLNGGSGAVQSLSFRIGTYLPCREAVRRLSPEVVAGVLDDAGERRFRGKAGVLTAEIATAGVGQCLYQNIMVALGYARNKEPFLELARRLPLRSLESAGRAADNEEDYLVRQQALLVGTAGLLPSQRPGYSDCGSGDEWVRRLEAVSASLSLKSVMSCRDWCLFKVRPHNHPVRRLVAMSYILLRFRQEGVLSGVVNLVRKSVFDGDAGELERSLSVICDGYWASHCDFGLRLGREYPALLGGERAAEMAVNVLLPFILVWSRASSQPELGERALEVFRCYHGLPLNAVTRHMIVQLGVNGKLVNSAHRQQGLIHLYQNYCIQGKCETCLLRQALLPGRGL